MTSDYGKSDNYTVQGQGLALLALGPGSGPDVHQENVKKLNRA